MHECNKIHIQLYIVNTIPSHTRFQFTSCHCFHSFSFSAILPASDSQLHCGIICIGRHRDDIQIETADLGDNHNVTYPLLVFTDSKISKLVLRMTS